MRYMKDWVESFVEYCYNTEPKEIYKKWVGISTIASALQRKCFCKWGRSIIYPHLYIVLIGPSSVGKSTALYPGLQIIQESGADIKIAVDSTSRASFIRDLRGAQTVYTNPETGAMYMHSSITVYSFELTAFLGNKDITLCTDLTDWYDSVKNPWVHKTISGSAQEIPGVWLNVIGGTTPENLRSSLPIEAIGGGLVGRFIFVYAQTRGKKVIDDSETPKEIELRKLLAIDLASIAEMGGVFTPNVAARVMYNDWYEKYFPEVECKDAKYIGYFGRKATTLKKLSMILSAARRETREITEDDFGDALLLLAEIEQYMYYSLTGMGRNQYADVMSSIMVVLELDKETTVPKLLHRFRDDVNKFELEKILETLYAMGYCMVYDSGRIVLNKDFQPPN